MGDMRFNIGDTVTIEESGETGRVIGCALFETCDPEYLVRYKSADGRAVQVWWTQSALVAGS